MPEKQKEKKITSSTEGMSRREAFERGTYSDQIKLTTAKSVCSKCGYSEKFDPWASSFCPKCGGNLKTE